MSQLSIGLIIAIVSFIISISGLAFVVKYLNKFKEDFSQGIAHAIAQEKFVLYKKRLLESLA
jgi:hypothetical protein